MLRHREEVGAIQNSDWREIYFFSKKQIHLWKHIAEYDRGYFRENAVS